MNDTNIIKFEFKHSGSDIIHPILMSSGCTHLVSTVTPTDVQRDQAVDLSQQLDAGLTDVFTEVHVQVGQVVASETC